MNTLKKVLDREESEAEKEFGMLDIYIEKQGNATPIKTRLRTSNITVVKAIRDMIEEKKKEGEELVSVDPKSYTANVARVSIATCEDLLADITAGLAE